MQTSNVERKPDEDRWIDAMLVLARGLVRRSRPDDQANGRMSSAPGSGGLERRPIMPVPRLLDEAASRMLEASRRIEQACIQAASAKGQRKWLAALTDFVLALADVQRFSSESIHEKLHELAGRTGLKKFPAERLPRPKAPEMNRRH
jgi:hypothetical protein